MAPSLPNSIPQLVAIVQPALPANFQVAVSRVPPVYVPPQSLLITGVRFTLDGPAEIAGTDYKHEEHYNIACSLFSSAGGSDPITRMTEVYTLYDEIQAAIANNADLNGTIRLAYCKQLGYTPGTDANGLDVGQLDFQVYCEARVKTTS